MAKVLIIGGGPAGMFAAAAAVATGAKVTLLEKSSRLGKKMILTGGGRGNLTNTATLHDFINNIPGNGKFLFSALNNFSGNDCREFFQSIGIPTKVEDEGRVFPVFDDAGRVVHILENYLKTNHVTVINSAKVTGLIIKDHTCIGVQDDRGRAYPGEAIIVATGGASYPHTGSTGDGYTLAEQAGHRITPLYPSLVSLYLAEKELCRQLQGLSLKGVRLSLATEHESKPATESGEIIFTHFGLSGPAALRLSRVAARWLSSGQCADLCLTLDLLPQYNQEELTDLMLSMSSRQPQKTPLNIVKQLLPNRLADVCVNEQQTSMGQKSGATGKKVWRVLAGRIKNLPFTVTGTKPLAEAMITAGGVSLEHIDPRTMASRLINGLYFAGEVMDLDAYTGGFNLQIAFSTGWVAGKSAARMLLQ